MVLKFLKMFDAADTKLFFLIRIEYLRHPHFRNPLKQPMVPKY